MLFGRGVRNKAPRAEAERNLKIMSNFTYPTCTIIALINKLSIALPYFLLYNMTISNRLRLERYPAGRAAREFFVENGCMKIMHIIGGGDRGGAKTHVLSLIKALSSDTEIELISLREGDFADEARRLGLKVSVVARANPFIFWPQIYKMAIESGADIIHCHGAKANLLGALLRSRGLRVISTVHSDYRLDYMGSPLKQATFGLINAVSLRFLSGYAAVSETMMDMLISRGFNPEKISVIYNGLDFSREANPVPRDEFLVSLGLDWDDKVVCGVAARLEKVKDLATLINGFAGALKSAPDLRLLIAGEGEERANLEALVARLGIASNVHFAGWVSDIDSFMNALDISLLTSISETFPYTVLEGVKFHCASVVTAVGGMPALIDDGFNGFIIKPGDASALSERLARLTNDPDLRRDFAERLFEKASREFSIKAMRDTQRAIYDRLLNKKPDGSPKKRVMVCGAYGRGNSGDDAILEAIVSTLRGMDENLGICALSRKPRATRLSYHISSFFIFSFFRLARELKRTDLFISGGGTLIQDATSTRSLLFYLYAIYLAKRSGAKVMLYGCGIGPVEKRGNVRRARSIINKYADAITLRERLSLETLSEFGIEKPKTVLTADPALCLSGLGEGAGAALLEREGLEKNGKYICFAIRDWKGFDPAVITRAADRVWEKHSLIPVFIPMENPTDLNIIERAAAGLKCPCLVLRSHLSPSEMISVLGNMKAVVGMRLHSLIFAASQGVEVVGLAYDPKVAGFMEYMNLDLCVDIDRLDAETLDALIGTAVVRAGSRSAERLQNAEALRLLERGNGGLAGALLEL